jgi:anti-sigma factor RsiW
MTSSIHPVEREEVMAYLDGELPAERAAVVAAHLEKCAECTMLAADLNSVPERLSAWHVEPSPAGLTERVTAALKAQPLGPAVLQKERAGLPALGKPPRLARILALGFVGGLAVLVVVGTLLTPNLLRSRIAAKRANEVSAKMEASRLPSPLAQFAGDGTVGIPQFRTAQPSANPQAAGPMIVRTAALSLVTKELDKARTALEASLRQRQGYIAELTVTGYAGAGRTLTSTLRVPANQLEAVVTEFKKLGRVEQESQGGEEVTQQYVDLSARLSNARNTEQRLLEVLRQRTGKVGDILAVEKEIARVREEIERMDAERKSLENRVSLTTIQLRMSEEYRAEMEVAPPSTGTRLRNAVVEGYHDAIASVLAVLLFLLRYGPSLLLWGLLLFWPARFAWRRVRTARTSRLAGGE